MIEDIAWKQHLISNGQRYIIRRIDPKTRGLIAEVYAPTLPEARTELDQGCIDCTYEIRDLFTHHLYQRSKGGRDISKSTTTLV